MIEFGAYVWLLTDPVTAVGGAPLAEVPCVAELQALIKAKYATTVNRWTALGRDGAPGGLLTAAVDGDLARSRVWREVLSRYGIRDVGPVVLVLDESLRIVGRTAASQAWLDVLLPPQPDEQAVPASVYNVAAQLLAAEEGVDGHPAYSRTHLAGGCWLTLRAARLSASQIVVTIFAKTGARDRVTLLSRALGTRR